MSVMKFTPGMRCVIFGSKSALPRISYLSPEDYLHAERLAETKSDYADINDQLELESIGVNLTLAEIYERIEFEG